MCESVTAELDSDLSTLQGTIMQLYQALRTKGKASADLVACLEYNRHSIAQASSSSTTNPSTRSKSSSKSKSSASKTPTSASKSQKSSTPLSTDTAHSGKCSTLSNGKNVQESSKKNSTSDIGNIRAENGPASKKAKTSISDKSADKKERETNHSSDSTDFKQEITVNGSHDNDVAVDCDNSSFIKTQEIDAIEEAMETSVSEEAKLKEISNGSSSKVNGVKQRLLRVDSFSENFSTTADGSNLEQFSNCV